MGVLAPYRTSRDADHLVHDLAANWDDVLNVLDQLEGWTTAELRERHTILGSLRGIEASFMDDDIVAQHGFPMDVAISYPQGKPLRTPTLVEMLRLKSRLLMFRNMSRDYADCEAMASRMDNNDLYLSLSVMETRYPLRPHPAYSHDGTTRPLSFLEELHFRLNNPTPKDSRKIRMQWGQQFRLLEPDKTPDWEAVAQRCKAFGRRVKDIDTLLSEPASHPELAERYGVETAHRDTP